MFEKIGKYFVVMLLLCGWISTASAMIHIPDTPQERIKRVRQLEAKYKGDYQGETLKEIAMIYAIIAGTDDSSEETIHEADKLLAKACKRFPKDYELMATHGSVITMLANFQSNPAKQLHFVKKGTRKMDRALKRDPDNIGALLQRANNSLHMPPFMKRTHYAKRDFQHVLKLVGDRRGNSFKAMILFNLGQALEMMKEHDDAKKQWEQAAALKTPYWSKLASDKL